MVVSVMEPDKDDWRKFLWLLQYLHGTIHMPIILRADNLNLIQWWVDDFYVVYGDIRGHNGATMSLGCGS